MNTTASRGLVALAAAPLAAACIFANVLGISAVAHASTVVPGVNAHASGMVLSKEYIAEQKEEHGASAKPIDLQMQQEASAARQSCQAGGQRTQGRHQGRRGQRGRA